MAVLSMTPPETVPLTSADEALAAATAMQAATAQAIQALRQFVTKVEAAAKDAERRRQDAVAAAAPFEARREELHTLEAQLAQVRADLQTETVRLAQVKDELAKWQAHMTSLFGSGGI